MARLLKVENLEAKRRALAAESEVYRQALTLEIQNLRLYQARLQQRFNPMIKSAPMLKLVLPVLTAWLARRRKGKWSRLVSLGLTGWKAYQRFGPALTGLFSFRSRSANSARAGESRAPAANI